MTLKELAVKHDYYCSDTNYCSNDSCARFDNWRDFLNEMGGADLDYNLCFRFDVNTSFDDEGEEIAGKYYAEIFIMQQRKGKFVPITIKEVTEEDAESIVNWLHPRWEHLKNLWNPINTIK